MSTLGSYLMKHKGDRSLSRFAADLCVPYTTLRLLIETAQEPRIDTMKKIANGLGVPLVEVMSAVAGQWRPQ
jgi:hypothetical protein